MNNNQDFQRAKDIDEGRFVSSNSCPAREGMAFGDQTIRSSAVPIHDIRVLIERTGLRSQEDLRTLVSAFDLGYRYLAPLIVHASMRILSDLRSELSQSRARCVFVGRDAHSLALAVKALDGNFFNENCSELVLSRRLMELAIVDAEKLGGTFPRLDCFRAVRNKVDPQLSRNAFYMLTRYLECGKISLTDGSHITLIDTSFRGSIQEALAALYPSVKISGKYLFLGYDTPERRLNKEGYISENSTSLTPRQGVPKCADEVFLFQDGIGAIEELLEGSRSSPICFQNGDVVQHHQRELSAGSSISPLKICSAYSNPAVRDAVREVLLLSVNSLAQDFQESADKRNARGLLDKQITRLKDELFAWMNGQTGAEREFQLLLDSFVSRSGKEFARELAEIASELSLRGVDPSAMKLWETYDECKTFDERKDYLERVRKSIPSRH